LSAGNDPRGIDIPAQPPTAIILRPCFRGCVGFLVFSLASDNVSKSVFKLGYPWSLGVVRVFPSRPQALAPAFPPPPPGFPSHLLLFLSLSACFPLSLNAFNFAYRDRLSFLWGLFGPKTLAASGSGWLCGRWVVEAVDVAKLKLTFREPETRTLFE